MWIKTTMNTTSHPLRRSYFLKREGKEKENEKKCWRVCREAGTLGYWWWLCKMEQVLWKPVCQFFKKSKTELPYDPAVPFLGLHTPKRIKSTESERQLYTEIHSSTIHNSQKVEATKCWPMDGWRHKIWYMYIMEYHLALKRKILIHATT